MIGRYYILRINKYRRQIIVSIEKLSIAYMFHWKKCIFTEF